MRVRACWFAVTVVYGTVLSADFAIHHAPWYAWLMLAAGTSALAAHTFRLPSATPPPDRPYHEPVPDVSLLLQDGRRVPCMVIKDGSERHRLRRYHRYEVIPETPLTCRDINRGLIIPQDIPVRHFRLTLTVPHDHS